MEHTPQKQSVKALKSKLDGQPSPFDPRAEARPISQYTHTGGFLRNRKQPNDMATFPAAEKTDCNF